MKGFALSLSRFRRAIRILREAYRAGGVCRAAMAFPRVDEILKDKTVLVTGGSSGIGLAIAKRFIATGATVVITGRDAERLAAAVREIGSSRVHALIWDVSDLSVLEERLAAARTALGGEIDILVNNAGVAPRRFFGQVDDDEWARIYETNLKGPYFLMQALVAVWRHTPSRRPRKIINISSQGGFVGATYPYRMVKWDVRGLTEGLGLMLARENIIVNGIAPGVVKTAMQQFALDQGDNLYTDQNPLRRVCLPEEIAELALFLAGDTGNFIVGQTIVCDGGYTLK